MVPLFSTTCWGKTVGGNWVQSGAGVMPGWSDIASP